MKVGGSNDNKPQIFYDTIYRGDRYSAASSPEEHSFYPTLTQFILQYDLQTECCLEVGCGRGAFQDVVTDYVGIDISRSVSIHFHKPFCQSSATNLPFEDNAFDAVWSYAVLEHVPSPELALLEIRRVLKPNGLLLLSPAWQCRPWAANGYPVRPYSDFDLKGKLIKVTIPIRDAIWFRALYVFPKRLRHLIYFWRANRPIDFHYQELQPNYEHFWMSDSDAVNSMDPFDAVLWFASRGDVCLSHQAWMRRLFVRTGSLIFRICKAA